MAMEQSATGPALMTVGLQRLSAGRHGTSQAVAAVMEQRLIERLL